jgi:hypothetical protein
LKEGRLKILSSPMKASANRKCLCCGEFFSPDHRNVHHQRYCSKPACRQESKAHSQRQWQRRPENKNYFRGPENRQRVKDWRKRNPGYWRNKKSSTHVPLQEVFQAQLSDHEQLILKNAAIALQDLFPMQPTVFVGLISMLAGSALQDDIVETTQALRRKGEDILGKNVP